MCSSQPWKHVSVFVWSILSINFFEFFFWRMILFHFVNCSSLSFNYWVILRRWKSGQRKKYGAVRQKNWLKLNITLYLILFNYISHLSELEFYFLCDCTNQKRKTIERCVKERLEQVVRVQLFCISWDKRKCWELWLRLALL